MTGIYTETFEQFLQNENECINADEMTTNEKIEKNFDIFPDFSIVINDETVDISFWEMFRKYYLLREIGSNDESIFRQNIERKCTETFIEYANKIKSFIDGMDSLADRKVNLQYETEQNDFYNPINVTGVANLYGKTKQFGNNDKMLSWFTSTPKIYEEINKLKSIYMEAIYNFECCFMGVL